MIDVTVEDHSTDTRLRWWTYQVTLELPTCQASIAAKDLRQMDHMIIVKAWLHFAAASMDA